MALTNFTKVAIIDNKNIGITITSEFDNHISPIIAQHKLIPSMTYISDI